MRRYGELLALLASLEGRPYPFYKDLEGIWHGAGFSLRFVHVQGDPFASPSVLEVHYPKEALGGLRVHTRPEGRVAVEDFLLRSLKARLRTLPSLGGSGHSGAVLVAVESPKVLKRAGAHLGEEGLFLRFRLGLPARGRRILGKEAERLFRALEGHLRAFSRSLTEGPSSATCTRRRISPISRSASKRGGWWPSWGKGLSSPGKVG